MKLTNHQLTLEADHWTKILSEVSPPSYHHIIFFFFDCPVEERLVCFVSLSPETTAVLNYWYNSEFIAPLMTVSLSDPETAKQARALPPPCFTDTLYFLISSPVMWLIHIIRLSMKPCNESHKVKVKFIYIAHLRGERERSTDRLVPQ